MKEQVETAFLEYIFSRYTAMRALAAVRIPVSLSSRVSAEDVVQQAFLAATRDHLKGRFSPTHEDRDSRLSRIVVNTVRDHIRYAMRRKRHPGRIEVSHDGVNQSLVADQRSPSSEDALRESSQAARAALAGLRDDRRAAVTMRYLNGLTSAEIARSMGISQPRVRALIRSGTAQLRRILPSEDHFFTSVADGPT